MKLAGKTAIVTGGASGIGKAIAQKFIQEGARVAIADLQAGLLETTAKEIGALAVPTDVGSEAAIKALVKQVEDKLGPIDVFVSNAGLIRDGDEATSDADWNLNWSVHVMSMSMPRALWPRKWRRAARATSSTRPRPPGFSPPSPRLPTS